ncbi:MAG: hypothetical protein IPK72_07115 [Candidatus Eisenbacteria bacterium]|nr:hypothetical protein [Candidatus Eisenbacteria bacterium]
MAGVPPGRSIGQRFLDLFIAPSRAFVAPRPVAMLWIGLALIAAVQLLDAVLLHDLQAARQLQMTERILDRDQNLAADKKAEVLAKAEGNSRGTRAVALEAISRIVAIGILGVLLPAALLLFGVNFGFAGRARFIDTLIVTTFSYLVTVPRDAILIPLRRLTGTLDIYAGPAVLSSPDSGLLFYVLMMFDLFDLYHLVPLALGLALVGGISRGKAWTLVLIFWGVWVLFTIGMASLAVSMGVA